MVSGGLPSFRTSMIRSSRLRSLLVPASALRALRLVLLAAVVPAGDALSAQSLTSRDTMLVGRVLLAEDRRDAADPILREALGHTDARVRTLAQRALGRITDPKFVRRDSLHPSRPTGLARTGVAPSFSRTHR